MCYAAAELMGQLVKLVRQERRAAASAALAAASTGAAAAAGATAAAAAAATGPTAGVQCSRSDVQQLLWLCSVHGTFAVSQRQLPVERPNA
jgi:uncharacterized UBP type Zn finger protein